LIASEVNNLQVYDSWDLARPSITPRSRLYHIEPVGRGTPYTESFTSYIARLAHAHSFTIHLLFARELFPQSNIPVLIKRASLNIVQTSVERFRPLNGKGRTALQWLGVVERLTLQAGLNCLTMLAWRHVLSDNFLLRQNRSWCPICLHEQRSENRTIYEQLLWTLTVVKHCPQHRIRLETTCPHCERPQTPVANKLIPGRCSRCLGWLGISDRKELDAFENDDLQYELWVATEMGLLIAAAPNLMSEPSAERLSKFLRTASKQMSSGNANSLARYLGMTPTACQAWRSKKKVPQINLLLQVCYRSSTSLRDLLTDVHPTLNPNSMNRMSEFPRGSERFKRHQEINTAFLTAFKEQPPPSVREVARRLGFKEPTPLYVKHAKLCKRLTSIHREVHYRRACNPTKRTYRDSVEVYSALKDALKENPLPTLAEIARRLGFADSRPLKLRFPELCELIRSRPSKARIALERALAEPIPPTLNQIAKSVGYAQYRPLRTKYPELCDRLVLRQKEFRIHERNRMRASLESILIENPPPSLEESAKSFGYKSFKSSIGVLMKYFPELCKAIKARHIDYRKQKTKKLELQLKEALQEIPPPSFQEVVGGLEYSGSYVSRRFPKEVKAIKRRRREFKRRRLAEGKEKAKARIEQIASALHTNGRYPALRAVQKACNGRIGVTSTELVMILREVRLKLGLDRAP